MREREIQCAILEAVSARPGAVFWRANSFLGVTASRHIVRANVPGTSDILGCDAGRFVAIEVKVPDGIQSESQKRFQRAVVRAGGIYVIAHSVDDALAALA